MCSQVSGDVWASNTSGTRLPLVSQVLDSIGQVSGELVFHLFGAIAHFERRLIAERTKDGIATARTKGKRPGRQPLDADRISLPH